MSFLRLHGNLLLPSTPLRPNHWVFGECVCCFLDKLRRHRSTEWFDGRCEGFLKKADQNKDLSCAIKGSRSVSS